jgi:hypothetical protein
MKVAMIFATDGSNREDAVLGPFRSAGFFDGLRSNGVDAVAISLIPDAVAVAAAPPRERACRAADLGELVARSQPGAIQTFGPEHRLTAVWQLAAQMKVPLVHCASCWRDAVETRRHRIGLSLGASLAGLPARHASRNVDALLSTSRNVAARLIARRYFPNAAFSAVVPPPVDRSEAPPAKATRTGEPVFGIYDPFAAADRIAFISRTVELTGRPNVFDLRIALNAPPAGDSAAHDSARSTGAAGAARPSFVAAAGIADFLAAIDVLAVPAYDDSVAPALVAALRVGKSVIVPDQGGAAELIEYGRHGLMFCEGSAYHFANALNLVRQSWIDRPVLRWEEGPSAARTEPLAVAQSFARAYARLPSRPLNAPSPTVFCPSEDRPRIGVVALGRSDRRQMSATLQSIAGLAAAPDALVLAAPKTRAHLFDDLIAAMAEAARPRLVTAETADALPLADGFRAIAPMADLVVFVPEGVMIGPDYLASVQEAAQRWQDMVGEIGVIHRVVDDPASADRTDGHAGRTAALRTLRARTLGAKLMWVRTEACGNLRFLAFPQSSEYLAFSSLLDQLRGRGRTRVVACDAAVELRSGPERRSGYEAGRELYAALSRIGEWRDRSDAALNPGSSYLDPGAEKLRLFGQQIVRYVASPATRAHVGSFLRGMWAARREAAASRHRIRDDIRNLG